MVHTYSLTFISNVNQILRDESELHCNIYKNVLVQVSYSDSPWSYSWKIICQHKFSVSSYLVCVYFTELIKSSKTVLIFLLIVFIDTIYNIVHKFLYTDYLQTEQEYLVRYLFRGTYHKRLTTLYVTSTRYINLKA